MALRVGLFDLVAARVPVTLVETATTSQEEIADSPSRPREYRPREGIFSPERMSLV